MFEFTGERYISELDSPAISYEHWHRYLYASRWVKNKTVLDIACGEGYGSYLLAQTAEKVLGVDINNETINYAAGKYVKDNIEFKAGSAGNIPVEGAAVFDVITSFETIEHITEEEQAVFLKEVKRLLKPEGIFIASTPNKLFYSDIPRYTSEFHLKEFYAQEFREFLGNYFKHTKLLGQKVYPVSYIWNQDSGTNELTEYKLNFSEKGFHPTEEPKDTLYLIVIASDEEMQNPEVSVLVDLSERILKAKDKQIDDLKRTIQEKDIHLQEIIRDKNARILELETHEKNIYNSLGWRLLAGGRKTLDRILPLHTRRRLLAKLVLQSMLNPAEVLKHLNLTNAVKFIHHFIYYEPSVLEEIIRAKLSGQTVNQPLFLPQGGWEINLNINELEPINFKTLEPPQVSIIIPVYNNWEYTYNCLKSIHMNTDPNIPFEVIIADDASTDETARMLRQVSGIKIMNNPTNLGFLKNCNQAAEHAQGKYILLLNNDTEVKPGWLTNLLKTAESDEKIGLVGGKLLYPDGRIQEAGGVLGKDGLEYPCGRFDDPEKYEYNYLKEVDCLIGACLLIRKEVFFKAGKFDEMYAPAFYEEFDLEFALREAGYKIMYQPQTVIIHHLSSSYGPEIRNAQSGRNQAKFMERWAHRLKEQPEPEEDIFLARDRSKNKKIILVIDDRVPDYDNHAGSLLTYQYLRLFQEMGFKVIFIPDSLTSPEPYTSELQQLGIEVVYGRFEFTRWIKQNGRYLHYAWLARPEVAVKYIDAIKRYSPAKILYLTVDLHYLRESRRYQIEKTAEALQKSKRFRKLEFSLFEKADCILTPSDYERNIIKKELPEKSVAAIPIHYYETDSAKEKTAASFEERTGLLFLGGFKHVPNVDAVKWLVKDIYPVIKQKIPDLKLYIIGSNPPADIIAFDNTDIIVTGYVKDLAPLFCRARVFVSPLRYGAGVKGKIITSLSYGVPVVTTGIGNEGINLKEGIEAFIADDAAEFARKTIELYKNPETWMKLSNNSRSFIKHNFSKDRAKHTLMEALDIVIGKS